MGVQWCIPWTWSLPFHGTSSLVQGLGANPSPLACLCKQGFVGTQLYPFGYVLSGCSGHYNGILSNCGRDPEV